MLEVIALGVLSGLRPATSQAAVLALLRTPSPRRLLLAFALAGLAFSSALGVVIVVAFGGVANAAGRSTFPGAFDLLAGVAALGFAFGLERGSLGDRIRERRANAQPSRIAARLHRPSTATAAFAGVATHIPGLIYLVTLNAIAAEDVGTVRSAFQVLVYNLLWFSLPLAALALSVASPGTATALLERPTAWARAHRDRLLVALFGALGVYLVAKGLLDLLS